MYLNSGIFVLEISPRPAGESSIFIKNFFCCLLKIYSSIFFGDFSTIRNIIANLIDEIPILCIAASFASGQTKIEGAEELRVKESDRLNAVARGLERLETNFVELDDGIIIDGGNNVTVKNININSYHDHRIAMSFLIASLRSTEAITVDDCSNIETSFPSFMHVMNRIGLNIHEA